MTASPSLLFDTAATLTQIIERCSRVENKEAAEGARRQRNNNQHLSVVGIRVH